MVIIISAKDFLEKPKKLYKARETHIINGSDNDDILTFSEGENKIADLIPSKSVLKGERLTKDEIAKKTKNYLKGEGVTRQIAVAVANQLREPDSNTFIILDKKVYNALGEKLEKRFNKVIGIDEGDLIVRYTDFTTICKVYRKIVGKKLDKANDKYDKLVDNDEKSMRDKHGKLAELNDMLDKLEDEYDAPDKLEARKIFLKEAEPSKDTVKKMKKFLKDNEDIFNPNQYEVEPLD